MSLYPVALIPIELAGHFSIRRSLNGSENLSCILSIDSVSDQHAYFRMSYGWLAIPSTVYCLGGSLVGIAGLQLVSAQVPYSMKGLLLGLTYLFVGISTIRYTTLLARCLDTLTMLDMMKGPLQT